MGGDVRNGGSKRSGADKAAESTHHESRRVVNGEIGPDSGLRGADAFFPSAKSMRLTARPARGGLAARIVLPIVVALVLGLTLSTLVMRSRMRNTQLADLRNDAATAAFLFGMMGRHLLSSRQEFLERNPAYGERSEWLAGDYWVYADGFVGAKDWIAATGFNLNEYAPKAELEAAAEKTILADMGKWVNSARPSAELVAIFILDATLQPLAITANSSFKFDALSIKAIPPSGESLDIAGMRVFVDYLDNLPPEPMMRGVTRIMSNSEPAKQVGTACVILRTHRHEGEQRAMLLMAVGLAGILTIAIVAVAWKATRRVTAPMRRLATDMHAMAEGDFTRRSGLNQPDEIGMLAQAFNSMAERLRVARANERENNRLESDLAIARSIQNNLLPLQTPRVRGLDMHTSYRPAKEIGGDYFDFLPVDSQHMGIVIADASGKSIPAALVMSTTRAILRFVAPGNASAAETLTRINAILSVDIPKGMFVTAYYVILDPLNSAMLCASAGHTPLLIARADGSVELMNPGGIALGFDSGQIFQRSIREQRVLLEQGDRVLLYTDGVVECVNPANEEYSDRRLREFLRRNRELSSHDFVGALLADLDRHRGTAEMRDDTTIVTFKVL